MILGHGKSYESEPPRRFRTSYTLLKSPAYTHMFSMVSLCHELVRWWYERTRLFVLDTDPQYISDLLCRLGIVVYFGLAIAFFYPE